MPQSLFSIQQLRYNLGISVIGRIILQLIWLKFWNSASLTWATYTCISRSIILSDAQRGLDSVAEGPWFRKQKGQHSDTEGPVTQRGTSA